MQNNFIFLIIDKKLLNKEIAKIYILKQVETMKKNRKMKYQ